MIDAARIAEAVSEAIESCAVTLRSDVREALASAVERERSERGRLVLGQLLANAELAERERLPLCQDTGTVWVCVEVGAEECVHGDLQRAIDDAVRATYRRARLRMSVVADALVDRENTNDNTPAFIEVAQRSGAGATVRVMLKGGGSDNASRVAMLTPADGWSGVRAFVLDTVTANAAAACPPVVLGIGVGSTFDRVASLSKHALLRRLDEPTADARIAAFEHELLAAVNATGIGPAGLGGDTTALGVRILTAPCHIAALPVAVNLGCCAMRSAVVEVVIS